MAALTANYDAGRKDGDLVSYKVKGSTKIYQNALVSVDATGYLIPARSGTATDQFVGVAREPVDNSAGADGAKSCRVEKGGTYVYNKASASMADVGDPMYASDDNTVTATSTNNQLVGYVVGPMTFPDDAASTTQVRIRIDRAVQ